MKNYYTVDYIGKLKTVSEPAAKKLLNSRPDYITWYEDENNVFIGDCANDEETVINAIVDNTGKFNNKFALYY